MTLFKGKKKLIIKPKNETSIQPYIAFSDLDNDLSFKKYSLKNLPNINKYKFVDIIDPINNIFNQIICTLMVKPVKVGN